MSQVEVCVGSLEAAFLRAVEQVEPEGHGTEIRFEPVYGLLDAFGRLASGPVETQTT